MISECIDFMTKKYCANFFHHFHNWEKFFLTNSVFLLSTVQFLWIKSYVLIILWNHCTQLKITCISVDVKRFAEVWLRQKNILGNYLLQPIKRILMQLGSHKRLILWNYCCQRSQQMRLLWPHITIVANHSKKHLSFLFFIGGCKHRMASTFLGWGLIPCHVMM